MKSNPPELNYSGLWSTLAAMGLFVALLVAFAFREEQKVDHPEVLVPEPEIP